MQDLFDKLPELITFGDVLGTVQVTQQAGADTWVIDMSWRFRGKLVGWAKVLMSLHWETVATDDYKWLWYTLEFTEDYRDQGLYSKLLKVLSEALPEYGITRFEAAPLDKTSEGVFMASGWEWSNGGLAVDLQGSKVKQWRSYKFGKGKHPAWCRSVMDERGLSDDVEAV